MLRLNGVQTAYDGVPMLQGLDLEVAPGELVCLLGPNGAGKTTTFRAITGIVKPTAGVVEIAGNNVNNWSVNQVVRLGVGVVPEGRRLFPKLSVHDNLRLGYQITASERAFEDMLAELVKRFPRVRERLNQSAGTLSGGEQAMVALCRALISEPRYIIMDEPSLGLSPQLVEDYFELVGALRGGSQAILLIEQNVEMSLAIADRAYVLSKGQLVDSGTPEEMRARGAASAAYLAG